VLGNSAALPRHSDDGRPRSRARHGQAPGFPCPVGQRGERRHWRRTALIIVALPVSKKNRSLGRMLGCSLEEFVRRRPSRSYRSGCREARHGRGIEIVFGFDTRRSNCPESSGILTARLSIRKPLAKISCAENAMCGPLRPKILDTARLQRYAWPPSRFEDHAQALLAVISAGTAQSQPDRLISICGQRCRFKYSV